MDKEILVANALVIPLTVGIVAALRTYLTGVAKTLAAALAAGGAAVLIQVAGYGVGWEGTPLVALIAWLSAMGTWSGGKALSGR